jgi:hypothetical protein
MARAREACASPVVTHPAGTNDHAAITRTMMNNDHFVRM